MWTVDIIPGFPLVNFVSQIVKAKIAIGDFVELFSAGVMPRYVPLRHLTWETLAAVQLLNTLLYTI